MDAPHYVQGQYSVAQRDAIFVKADKYPDTDGGLVNQVPTLTQDGTIIWRQQSSGGGDGTANANIAIVEETSTASQAYAVGDLLVYSGQLYRVTAAINIGGTITPGTNVTPTTVANELDNSVAGVSSFNSRTGVVVPQSGDYTAAMVGADASGTAASAVSTHNSSSTAHSALFLAKQAQIVYRTVTLAAANWSNGAQTVTVTGVSATETDQLIQPVPAAASRSAYESCGVQATAQATNSLTFGCESTPSSDLTVYVCITELEAAT